MRCRYSFQPSRSPTVWEAQPAYCPWGAMTQIARTREDKDPSHYAYAMFAPGLWRILWNGGGGEFRIPAGWIEEAP